MGPRLLDPLLIGAFGFTVSVVGAGRPSFWWDEAATISAATRGPAALWHLIVTADSAHPLYYFLMSGWFRIVPHTEFWVRLPSVLAVGIAAGGLVILARMFTTRTVAVTAGLVFAILPRITWSGIEARPYAMTCVASIGCTALLFVAVRRRGTARWVAYFAVLTVSILLNIHLAMLVGVHLVTLLALRVPKSVLRPWALSATASVLAVSPALVFLLRQSGQLDWIDPLGMHTFAVIGAQYFDSSVPFAVAVVGLVTVVAAVPRLRRLLLDSAGARPLLVVCGAWILVPMIALLIVSATIKPLYVARYLTFTSPAAAILIALTVVAAGRHRAGITAILVVLALAAAPNYVHQRSAYGKPGAQDFSQVADLIERQAQTGDCLLLDDTVGWRPGPIRPLVHARPDAYRRLVDVGLGRTAESLGELWDANRPPFLIKDRIARCAVIWVIAEKDPALPDHETGVALPPGPLYAQANAFWVPRDLGFRIVERWQFNISQVMRLIR